MVFQNYALFPHMSVAKNIGFGLRMRGVPRGRDRATRVERALKLVQLVGQEHKLPGQLSGGQQQRVAIARAIVIEPPLILMDEPLSNLDAKLRIETRAEIRRIHRELDRATIYVTHDQDEALSLADRIVVHEGGRRAADRRRRRMSMRSRPTCTSRASWVIATCSSSASSGATAIASRSRARTSRLHRRRASSRSPAAARRSRSGPRRSSSARGRRQQHDRGPRRQRRILWPRFAGRRRRTRPARAARARGASLRLGDIGRVPRSRRARARLSGGVSTRWPLPSTRSRAPVRPLAAAGRSGSGVHAAAVRLPVPVRAHAVVQPRSRAGRSPTTRISSRPTISGRRSGRRCGSRCRRR